MPRPSSIVTVLCLLILPALASADMRAQYQNGWPHITWNGQALTRSIETPSVSITVAGQRLPASPRPASTEPSRTVYEFPQGRLTDTLEPFEALPNCFVRRVVLDNAPDAQRDLVGADFRIAIRATENAPQWQAQSFAMVECAPGGPTLCVAFTSDEDPWRCKLTSDDGLVAEHHCATAWRLPPGGRATIGSQYIWVIDGDLSAARASAQRWYDAVGLTIADDAPDWLRDCILYQASAGGNVDSRFSDVGGFDSFARQLDYIADLGCNAFWLMSVLTHKDPDDPLGGWNLYSQTRYDEIDPALGGEAGLTRLVDEMRDRGFRIVGEIVPSGGRAELCGAHAEWWTYQPDGSRRTGFGHALDYSSPGWQAQIGETIQWLTANWGFDGYRVDVADGYGVNWSSPTNAPHVSRSTRAGSIDMLRTIREAALAGGTRQPCVIPEVSLEHPEYARQGPVGYGHAFLWAVQNAWTSARSPMDLRDRIRDYLEHERGSLPRGMIMLRCLNNHDTIVSSGRADRRFGVGLQRALTAVCAIIDGVPMIYQEQEVGSYTYLRRLFWARRRVPELRRGAANYSAVDSPPSVFTVLRSIGDSHAIGLVNLSPEPVEGEIRLPDRVSLSSRTTAHDAISGRRADVRSGRLTWRFEPYGAAILRIGKRPEGKVSPERHQPTSPSDVPLKAPLSWEETEDDARLRATGLDTRLTSTGLDIQSTPQPDGAITVTATATTPGAAQLSLQVLGVDLWSVDTVTGVYEDRLMRRHFPWPAGLYHWQPSYVWGYEPHNPLACGPLPLAALLRLGLRAAQSLQPHAAGRPTVAIRRRAFAGGRNHRPCGSQRKRHPPPRHRHQRHERRPHRPLRASRPRALRPHAPLPGSRRLPQPPLVSRLPQSRLGRDADGALLAHGRAPPDRLHHRSTEELRAIPHPPARARALPGRARDHRSRRAPVPPQPPLARRPEHRHLERPAYRSRRRLHPLDTAPPQRARPRPDRAHRALPHRARRQARPV